MKGSIAAALISFFSARVAFAAEIDGSVFLMRDMTTQFASVGRAQYVNDMNQPASAARDTVCVATPPPPTTFISSRRPGQTRQLLNERR
ncbi:MAG TPA: hypothetical protein VF698_08215 [Thermoanaerobaculia bacterium]|jgi:hypothetical protein